MESYFKRKTHHDKSLIADCSLVKPKKMYGKNQDIWQSVDNLHLNDTVWTNSRQIADFSDQSIPSEKPQRAVQIERPISHYFPKVAKSEYNFAIKKEPIVGKVAGRKYQTTFAIRPKLCETTRCKECNFECTSNQDDKEHQSYHSDFLRGVFWQGYDADAIVQNLHLEINGISEQCSIMAIPYADSTTYRRKFERVLKIVDSALGSIPQSRDDLKLIKGYLFLHKKLQRIIGCLIAKRINKAYSLQLQKDENSILKLNTKHQFASVCGIDRIWVHPLYRRNKIATAMLNAAKNDFVYGTKLETNQIAFSQPTADGFKLGKSFFNNVEFPVYLL